MAQKRSDIFIKRNAFWIASLVLFIIAAPSIWFVSRTEGFHNGYQQRETEQIERDANSELNNKCAASATVDMALTCAYQVIETANSQSHDAHDLEAQWQSATWAKLMLFITGTLGLVTVAVTYYGVVMVKETLVTNIRATTAATRATEIANKQFIAENRPWLKFTSDPIFAYNSVDHPMLDRRRDYVSVNINVENVGNSPAIGVTCSVKKSDAMEIEYFADRQKISRTAIEEAGTAESGGGSRTIFPTDQEEVFGLYPFEEPSIDEDMLMSVCLTYFMSGHKMPFFTCITAEVESKLIRENIGSEGTWILRSNFNRRSLVTT